MDSKEWRPSGDSYALSGNETWLRWCDSTRWLCTIACWQQEKWTSICCKGRLIMGKSGRRYVFWFEKKSRSSDLSIIMEFIFMQAKWWCHCCGTIVPSTQNRVVSPLIVQMKYSHRSIKITTALLVSRTNVMYWHSTNIAGNVRLPHRGILQLQWIHMWIYLQIDLSNQFKVFFLSEFVQKMQLLNIFRFSCPVDTGKVFELSSKVSKKFHRLCRHWSSQPVVKCHLTQTVNWSYFVGVCTSFVYVV